MSIPTIYSSTKQALPGEEITVIASIGEGDWRFPNATPGDIEIVSGTTDSNILTFKCLNSYDPLIVTFSVIQNTIKNGATWVDSIHGNVLGDYWVTPQDQYNTVLSGYNFNSRSQRITQTESKALITQENLTISGGEYGVELDYRATHEFELKVGGHTFLLPPTNEGNPLPIYPIRHDSGLVNFETTNGGNVNWILSDGTFESFNLELSKDLPAGTSYLIMDTFIGESVNTGNTFDNYVGHTSDIPYGLSIYESDSSGLSGNIWELNHIIDVVSITDNENIYGDVGAVKNLTSVLDLNGSNNISGDIGVLENTIEIYLNGCNVHGAISNTAVATSIMLNNTNLDIYDLEQSLINIASYATVSGLHNGMFECIENMPTVSSPDACAAMFTLLSLGWTIMINSECVYN